MFSNFHNTEFINRVAQMQRLQMDTVDWEKKQRQRKKKISKTNSNGNNFLNNVE